LTGSQLTVFLLGLAVLLACAHALGEVARRFGQPMVIGEMFAGLLLGPTFFGWLAPDAQQWLFPHTGAAATALDGIIILAVNLLLMVAGMEVDLSSVWRQGRATISVALSAAFIPLIVGSLFAWWSPGFWGMPAQGEPVNFAIFFGTALAVSALPVIAKILLDLDLFQSDFGVLVLVSATLCNLIAWLMFSIVLGGRDGGLPIIGVVVLTVGFAVGMLTVGCWLADRVLGWVQAHLSWPSGVLGFMLIAGLLGAAVTDAIGVHAIFGAFLTGIALGESRHMRDQTRLVVHRFVEGILAPIFVAAIGLEVNFITNFHPWLVLSVLVVGSAVKVLSGWALNARGELGIVIGLLAWEGGVIRERLFVALVMLAIVTSAVAGPMLKWLLRLEKVWSLSDLIDSRSCLPQMTELTAEESIGRLCQLAAEKAKLDPAAVTRAVLSRERFMGTGIGHGIAVPNARIEGLSVPVVVVGTSPDGLAFEGVDDEPVRLILVILTPAGDPASQLQILSSVGRLAQSKNLIREAVAARNAVELLGVLRVAEVLLRKKPK
jgi:Kef-type K+ transport system membrane component KefB/mannitol/fructose-specific phosphotransferase system IIA component (Ntr-type)